MCELFTCLACTYTNVCIHLGLDVYLLLQCTTYPSCSFVRLLASSFRVRFPLYLFIFLNLTVYREGRVDNPSRQIHAKSTTKDR